MELYEQINLRFVRSEFQLLYVVVALHTYVVHIN